MSIEENIKTAEEHFFLFSLFRLRLSRTSLFRRSTT